MTSTPIIERKLSTNASAPAIAQHVASAYARDGYDTLLISHDGKVKANLARASCIDRAVGLASFMAQKPSRGGIAIVIDNQPVHANEKGYHPIAAQRIEKLISDLQLALGQSLGLIYIQE